MVYKKVEIHWLDSHGITSDWEFIDELKSFMPVEVVSIGFLLEDEKDYKTIVQSYSESQVLGRMAIPATSILQIITLK